MAPAEGIVTPLKTAFAQARAVQDMGGVLPVFLRSRLFVVAVADGGGLQLYIRQSPSPGRMCVTVAESRDALAGAPSHLVHPIDMSSLLAGIVGTWDIVVSYGDGGDVLQAEYVPELRELLRQEGAAASNP